MILFRRIFGIVKYLNKEAVVSVDLSLEEALRYLRSETIAIDAPKGFCSNLLWFAVGLG